MKKLIIALSLVISQTTMAAITTGSDLEVRHLNVIEKAIVAECGNFFNLKQLSSVKELIKVDQGITDAKFETILEGKQKFDQFIDKYVITVKSEYSDSYDHSTKEWGSYHVSSVNCAFVYLY